jgi:Ca2+-binding RTX toxin-like protein
MATTQVDSTAALISALQHAQGGDVILLAAGTYSGASINGLSIPGGVTVTSADAAHQAVLTNFNILNSQGLTFSNVELFAQGTSGFTFQVKASSDIHFDNITLHGSLDDDPSNDASGLQVMGSSNITITNSDFTQLARGMAVSTSTDVTIENNYIHDIRSDGMDFAQVGNVRILHNILKDFSPATGDHPDAIQFWTQGTTAPSHDILISGNLITRGDGTGGAQGIFMGDELGTMHFQRVTISDNLLLGTGLNALRINGATGLTLSNNDLVTFAGQDKTYILIQNADGVTATGNESIMYGWDKVTGLTQSGNITTVAVVDSGLAALKAWFAVHPEDSLILGSAASGGTTTSGDLGDNVLNGSSGADLIFGSSGADTITDAGGSNYLRGDDGNDSVVGGAGFDDINGNLGNDTATGGLGDDWVVGGKDQDLLWGDAGADIVYGNLGADTCNGGDGNDVVRGGQQDDTLTGEAGNDWLSGDRDTDVMTGGVGADVFHTFGDAGIDRVTDFNRAEGDRVQLDAGTTYTVAQVGADTVISMTGGGQMILEGVQMSTLTPGWIFGA